MFNILKKLEKIQIFKKFFSENQKIVNNFNNCNFKIISEDNSSNNVISFDFKTQSLIVDESKLGSFETIFWELVNEFSQQKGNRLLENKTNNYLEKLKFFDSNENGAIIEFFKDIISTEDYKILKSAQFIIKQENSEISYLKKGIKRRYGDKGNRIVNLLSAGYFSFLKELYNSNENLFQEIYLQLVTEDVLTIFVHNKTNIMLELENKIKKFKTYRLKLGFIHIHGIGINNISKIKSFINENLDNNKFIIKNKFEKDRVYLVEIYPN